MGQREVKSKQIPPEFKLTAPPPHVTQREFRIKQANNETNNRKLSWTDVFLCIILATSNNLQNMF